MNEQLPITHSQALKVHHWLHQHFADNIASALTDTQYSPELVSAVFAQETAQRVLLWVDNYEPAIVLQRSIFDASGDFPGTTRNAFPKNAGEFHTIYGDEFTDMLISEANKMRRMPQPGDKDGYSESHFLYKGYGLFQYDLQHVKTDEPFFRNKLWYNFDECVIRLISELKSKDHGDLFETIKYYNGSGQNAENYAKNVLEFVEVIKVA